LRIDDLLAIRVLLGVLREGFLLGLVPVLVEPALDLLAQVLSPHRIQGAQTTWGLNVADHANHDHRRALNDGDRLTGLLLVQLGAGLLNLTYNVSHSGLVAHKGGQVHRLGGIIPGKGLDLTPTAAAALPGTEAQGAAPRMFELPMRHGA
ncbi:hypothetical protein Vretifemale_12553, partial [Volvox reticuliferus]